MIIKRIFLFVTIGVVSGQSPTRAPCVWLSRSDTNTKNGNATSYATLADCQTNCLNYNSCLYGLDWDQNNVQGIRCWFSTTAAVGSAPGVVHYYQNCAGSLTTDSIYTIPPPSTTVGPASTCQWFVSNDTNTKDGIVIPDANTVNVCRDKCRASTTCLSGYGFDFNANNPDGRKCFLSVNRQLYSTPGIQHHEPSASCWVSPNKSSSTKADLSILILFFFINKFFLRRG